MDLAEYAKGKKAPLKTCPLSTLPPDIRDQIDTCQFGSRLVWQWLNEEFNLGDTGFTEARVARHMRKRCSCAR